MMSNNAVGGLVALGLALFFLPIILVVLILWFIFKHADEIAAALVEIAKGIWQAHKYVGYGLLWLIRDLPVLTQPTETWADEKVRKAIAIWLAVPPFLLGAVWLLMAAILAGPTGSWAASLVIFLPSTVAVGIGYYLNYFERPVPHHRWPRFMAQYYLLRAEGDLAYIEKSLDVRLWVERQKAEHLSRAAD
jgi:hypothetical protein